MEELKVISNQKALLVMVTKKMSMGIMRKLKRIRKNKEKKKKKVTQDLKVKTLSF